MINMVKLPTKKSNLFLRVAKGHFATSHSHINYYIDVTTQKSRLSEARAVAKELVSAYQHSTIVDTVLCLDGTQVIGTCLANELTKDGFANMNAHQTIYVITPEYTTGSQIILRDNLAPMVKGKHVLILAASITTGYTVQAAIEAINYYGGTVAGLSAIFATTHECMGYEVTSIFDPASLPDYASFDSRDCPLCKAGQHIDALGNTSKGRFTVQGQKEIVGPGNIYVATAKRKVFGKVGIDMIAGPSACSGCRSAGHTRRCGS